MEVNPPSSSIPHDRNLNEPHQIFPPSHYQLNNLPTFKITPQLNLVPSFPSLNTKGFMLSAPISSSAKFDKSPPMNPTLTLKSYLPIPKLPPIWIPPYALWCPFFLPLGMIQDEAMILVKQDQVEWNRKNKPNTKEKHAFKRNVALTLYSLYHMHATSFHNYNIYKTWSNILLAPLMDPIGPTITTLLTRHTYSPCIIVKLTLDVLSFL